MPRLRDTEHRRRREGRVYGVASPLKRPNAGARRERMARRHQPLAQETEDDAARAGRRRGPADDQRRDDPDLAPVA